MVAMECGCSEKSSRRHVQWNGERKDGADVYRSQARKEVFWDNQRSGGDAEPHRGSESIVRPVPAREGAGRRPSRRGPAGCIQIGIPDFRLLQFIAARIREIRIRAAEV